MDGQSPNSVRLICPKCSAEHELSLPTIVRGVRCASCGTLFTVEGVNALSGQARAVGRVEGESLPRTAAAPTAGPTVGSQVLATAVRGSRTCPVCGSDETRSTKQTVPGFQWGNDRKCLPCGTVWTPGQPRWIAVAAIVFAVFCLLVAGAGTVLFFVAEKPRRFTLGGFNFGMAMALWFIFLIGGVAALGFAVAVFRGEKGPQIRKSGRPPISETRGNTQRPDDG